MTSTNKTGYLSPSRWLLVVGLAGALGASACVADTVDGDVEPGGDESIDATDTTSLATSWWRTIRAQRQAKFDQYLAANDADFQSFKDAPVGNSGVPMIMFRLFPELFPEIWGTPEQNFAPVGLGKDTLEPNRVLPLGLGFTGSEPAIATPAGPVKMQVVQLTCMGCHVGRVAGPTGTVQILPGAPSTQFTGFRTALVRTVTSPGYTADRFRAALAAKPAGWLFNDPALAQQEALERAIFLAPNAAEQFLATFQSRLLAGVQRFSATIGAHTYARVPNPPDLSGPTPGYLDALGSGMAVVIDPALFTSEQLDAILPPAPAPVDIMSVWLQNDRPTAQWDGSIASPLHRNLGAEFGVVGNPAAVSMENGIRTTRFTAALPAVPYPFDVDRSKAARGKDLYVAYCAGCHTAGSDEIFDPGTLGTDPNRADVWTATTAAALTAALRASCTDAVACSNPDGSPVPDDQIAFASGGYMAIPLDGIWARAPYLHNGSVPTLSALLTGDRPATFFRGNITYDQVKVGFTWDRQGPGSALFDTSKSGLSRLGHSTAEFNGNINWKREPGKLADLLEYLKTL